MDELSPAEATRRFPQISFEGIRSVFHEPLAGVLLARRACEHVVERVIAEGGQYRLGSVAAPLRADGPLTRLGLSDGGFLEADVFVIACGPWLATLMPQVIGGAVQPTRQEVFYFGTPAGDARFSEAALPAWIDFADRLMYGTPGNANRGFKLADDTPGPPIDPTSGDRNITPAALALARAFLARRFPALADAPLIGAEVCQYEASPDSHFIVDRHPAAPNVWILGGGSGHGFKMGPALGEMAASLVLGERQPDPTFALARFSTSRSDRDTQKWG